MNFLGRKSGERKDRKLIHTDGTWHRSCAIHLINSKKGTIIFQQRADSKDVCPGKLDAVVAGHYAPGESREDVISREMTEEVGVHLWHVRNQLVGLMGTLIFGSAQGTLTHVHSPRIEIVEMDSVINHELQDVVFLDSELAPHNLVLEKDGEVGAVVEFIQRQVLNLFLGYSDSIQNIAGKKLMPNGYLIDYSGRDWSQNDFWPTADNYFGKIADVAKRIGRGEKDFPGI